MDLNELLGPAALDGEFLADVVASILGRRMLPGPVIAERVPYEAGSPATGALVRLRGAAPDGQPWSVFVKVLQSPRHWPHLDQVPTHHRQEFIDSFPWRAELGAWDPAFTAALPAGLRVPVLYRQAELGDGRFALWMEDVATDTRCWPASRFTRAARLLGQFAANRRDPALLVASPRPPGFGLLRYYQGPVQGALSAIGEPSTWRHPALAGHQDLRGLLLSLAARGPAILSALDRLPQAIQHGDASPQNLLVPVADPDTFVAIDIAFQTPHAVGFDLAQLLVGLVHAGQLPGAALPAIHAGLAPAYAEGMSAGRRPAGLADVRRGYLGSLLLRTAFTALPWLDLGSAAQALVDERAALTRFVLAAGSELDW